MRFASFLSSWFITAIVVNPPEIKLAKRTSVLTASCWKENLSLDCPCESINKLSISLQIQVEDLIHFKGNVHKWCTRVSFDPPSLPKNSFIHITLRISLYYISKDWVGTEKWEFLLVFSTINADLDWMGGWVSKEKIEKCADVI